MIDKIVKNKYVNKILEERYDYKSDKLMQAMVKFFLWVRIFNKENEKINWKDTLLFYLNFLVISIPALCIIGYFAANTEIKLKTTIVLENIYLLLSTFIVHILIYTCHKENKSFNLLLKELGNYQKFGKPPKMKDTIRFTDFTFLCFDYYVKLGGIIYGIGSLLLKGECEKRKEVYGEKNVCGLFVNTWLIFDVDYFPVKQILFVVQYSCGVYGLRISAFLVMIAYSYVFLISDKIDHLMILLQRTFKENNKKLMHIKLKTCVKYHSHILEISNLANKIFIYLVIIQIAISAVVISVVLYILQQEKNIKYFVYFIGWLAAVFIQCYSGQKLLDKSADLEDHIAHLNWYHGSLSVQKDILFMLQRSQRPILLKSKGLGTLSLVTFAAIMKTSYSYVALLHNTEK